MNNVMELYSAVPLFTAAIFAVLVYRLARNAFR